MDTMFVNSWNGNKSDPHRLLLNLLHKMNLNRSVTMLLHRIYMVYLK